ncbi:amidase [Rubrobacter aplysinae]|uniref:amidase n=1 Tax=Rubrobacter aplysinae TaxID=909625 RepID=UPI00064C382A
MNQEDYARHDATGLATLVKTGEVSAGELLETAISRAHEVNPRLNAIVHPMLQEARSRADSSEEGLSGISGPFTGVPFLTKDLGQDYAGHPTSCGNRILASPPVPEHATVVRRWLEAGLLVFGKTNTPEFGAKGVTEPEAFGPTRNPWDETRTPGGSSGGSAAAVAAGIVPVAGASDGGGSIRIPAACCGLVGLKPGRGKVPHGPVRGEAMQGASTDGVVSRSVRDTAAMLDVLVGNEPEDPYQASILERPYSSEVGREPGRLRIGFTHHSSLNPQAHPEAVAAVTDAARLLEGLGHEVQEIGPRELGYDDASLARDFLTVWFANAGSLMSETRKTTGARAEDFELDTRIMAAVGRSTSAVEYASTLGRWHSYVRALADFHSRYDLLLTPTLARPPLEIGALDTPPALRAAARTLLSLGGGPLLRRAGIIDRIAYENLGWVPYTQLANVTGRPAVSLPTYRTADNLPLGVQFVAPLGGEPTLLRLASQIEQARPWPVQAPDRPNG